MTIFFVSAVGVIVFYAALRSYQLKHSQLEEAILRSLVSGEGAGLALADQVSYRLGRTVHSAELYPILRQIERDGLVTHREEPDTDGRRGGRPWNVYRLTSTLK